MIRFFFFLERRKFSVEDWFFILYSLFFAWSRFPNVLALSFCGASISNRVSVTSANRRIFHRTNLRLQCANSNGGALTIVITTIKGEIFAISVIVASLIGFTKTKIVNWLAICICSTWSVKIISRTAANVLGRLIGAKQNLSNNTTDDWRKYVYYQVTGGDAQTPAHIPSGEHSPTWVLQKWFSFKQSESLLHLSLLPLQAPKCRTLVPLDRALHGLGYVMKSQPQTKCNSFVH